MRWDTPCCWPIQAASPSGRRKGVLWRNKAVNYKGSGLQSPERENEFRDFHYRSVFCVWDIKGCATARIGKLFKI